MITKDQLTEYARLFSAGVERDDADTVVEVLSAVLFEIIDSQQRQAAALERIAESVETRA